MNTYFGLSSTNNHTNVQQSFETDYHRGHFRFANKDSGLMNTYSMMPTGTSTHLEQYHSTNEYFLPTSNGTSSTFSMPVTNPMLYYTHPWMRPGIDKLIKTMMIY
jgi:capsule polysaccharide modification protein KpsS